MHGIIHFEIYSLIYFFVWSLYASSLRKEVEYIGEFHLEIQDKVTHTVFDIFIDIQMVIDYAHCKLACQQISLYVGF